MAYLSNQPSSRLGTSQDVPLTGTSAAVINPFGAQTYQVRVVVFNAGGTVTSARIRIGDGTPTATTTDAAIPLNVPEYFSVTPGQKIAGILTGTTPTATMSVTEIA
jgi:hypothetical protein